MKMSTGIQSLNGITKSMIMISLGFIVGCTPLNESHNFNNDVSLAALNENPKATFSNSASITSLNRSDWPVIEARVASVEMETRPVYWRSYHFGGDSSVRDLPTYPTLETAYKLDNDEADQIASQYLEIVTDPFLQIFNLAVLPINMVFINHPTKLHNGPRGWFELTQQDLQPVQLYSAINDDAKPTEKDSE